MYTNITAFRLDRDNIDTRIINHGVDTVTIATELSGKIDRSIVPNYCIDKQSNFAETVNLRRKIIFVVVKKKKKKNPARSLYHEAP